MLITEKCQKKFTLLQLFVNCFDNFFSLVRKLLDTEEVGLLLNVLEGNPVLEKAWDVGINFLVK